MSQFEEIAFWPALSKHDANTSQGRYLNGRPSLRAARVATVLYNAGAGQVGQSRYFDIEEGPDSTERDSG
ncbi:hypothetical protein GCM10027278_17860 [Paralcaligenes ginsengisoli]